MNKARSFTVCDIFFDGPAKYTFTSKGQVQTVSDYYERTWGIKLDPRAPLLGTKVLNPAARAGGAHTQQHQGAAPAEAPPKYVYNYYPAEFCSLTGTCNSVHRVFNKNSAKLGEDMISNCAVHPTVRLQRSLEYLQQIRNVRLPGNDLEMGDMFFRFEALQLPTGTLVDGSGQPSIHSALDKETCGWTDFYKNNPKFSKTRVEPINWALLVPKAFGDGWKKEKIDDHMAWISKNASFRNGVFHSKAMVVAFDGETPADYKKAAEQIASNPKCQFVVAVIEAGKLSRMPGAAERFAPHYKAVKKACCAKGVGCQVFGVQTLERMRAPTMIGNKLLLQMSCKVPWALSRQAHVLWGTAVDKSVAPADHMFLGIDMASTNGMTMVGLCAYLETQPMFCKPYVRTYKVPTGSAIIAPSPKEEAALGKVLAKAVEGWKAGHNGQAPKHVVVFRDGGSRGDLPRLNAEAETIRKTMKCAVTYVCVLKNVPTRVFAVNGVQVSNPQPGTAALSVINDPMLPEFYLVNQNVDQGAATPTKYQVIVNDPMSGQGATGYSRESLALICFRLSLLYYNWNGPVRVPANMKVAGDAAQMVGSVLDGVEPHEKLHTSFYSL
eukprot:NODE_365_length_2034_cov_166.249607_g358_i0.p1 GENE.NODE_365_length_2034_cov_166.249607_g358_i0~~NODE_365_length_2034_cov_166.249607_g358_i0.p1  ORF type:complete len:643 (+),score=193.06 NODE_365_length_2034_cov_166.249607_g358_i0:106-1929(+)